MDPPDSTESVLSLSFDSEMFGHEPNNQSEANDVFLDDFFSGVQIENKESNGVADQLEIHSESEKTMESSQESPYTTTPSITEAMMDKLKQQIKELKERTLEQECELAKYEVELSEKMSSLLQVQMERDSLKENLKISDTLKSSLQLKLEEKEAELKQFKELVQKQVSEEEAIQKLKKQMANDARVLKKTERDLQRNTEQLDKIRSKARILTRRNKTLITALLEFGAKLEKKELLSTKKKKFLENIKTWMGELSETPIEMVDTYSSDEVNMENNNLVDKTNTDLNSVVSTKKENAYIKEEVNSPSSNDASLTFTANTESLCNGFVRSIKSSPFFSVDDDGLVGSTRNHKYAPSPLADENKVLAHTHVACKTEETAEDKITQLSPDSNFLSGTESQCSQGPELTDCFAFLKGLVLKSEFTPLSPLPPSPGENIRASHQNFQNKSENEENSKGCSLPSSQTDTSPESIQQEDMQFPQSPSNLEESSKTLENSDQTNSLCNVSSMKSNSPEPNSETLSCKNEPTQNLLKDSEVTGRSSNNCSLPISNIEQEISPASPDASPKSVEKREFSPAHSSILNEDEQIPSPSSPVFSVNMSVTPTSPKLSSEFLQKSFSQQNSTTSGCEKIDSQISISSPEKTMFSETSSSKQSPVCIKRKNIFTHQNSKGFEPHINELNEKGNSVPNKPYEPAVLSSEIPPELHYLSSTYLDNNKFKILHQGDSVYDYLINPETKLSVCLLTVPPKSTSSNQSDSSTSNACSEVEKLSSNEEERKKRVLSVYQATERRLSLINRQILHAKSPGENSNNSLNDNPSHIYVVVENKSNVSLNGFSDNMTLWNVNDSGMDLECTASEDILMKSNSSVEDKNSVDENQSFVSSSCDISTPSRKKLLSSSFRCHSVSQNDSSKNISSQQMESFNIESETPLNASKFTTNKKRLSHNDEDLPSKKQKIKPHLSTQPEIQKLNVLYSQNPADISSKTLKDSHVKSQEQLQNSITTSSPLSDNDNCDQIKSELKFKSQTLTAFSATQLTPKKNESNMSLSTDIDRHLFQKDSIKKSLVSSNISAVEIRNNPAKMSPLPVLSETNTLHLSLKNSSQEKNPSLCNFKLLNSPFELKNSVNSQPISDINSSPLKIKDLPTEQSISEVNNTLFEDKNSVHHHLMKHNSPSKEIPLCNFNKTQFSKSPLVNLTASESSNTPEKSVSKSQSVSDIVSPKVQHKKSLPRKKSNASAKGSKLKRLSKLKFSSKKINRTEQKKLPSYEPQSQVSITPSELKTSTDDQPLLDISNSHSEIKDSYPEIKDSPSEHSVDEINSIQTVLNNTDILGETKTQSDTSTPTFCTPELLSKSVESEEIISEGQSSRVEDSSSPSKNQTQLPVNITEMKLQDSPLKDTLEPCTSQILDDTSLSSKIQIKSEENNFQSELMEISSPVNSYVSSICSPLLYLEENNLVIDEQISVEEDVESDSKEDIIPKFEIECQEVSMINGGDDTVCLENIIEAKKVVKNSKQKKKKDKKSKSRKKKNKALQAKKKNLKSSQEEQSLCPILSIPGVLEQIDEVKILDSLNESHFKLHAHTLFSALINPSNASNVASALFQIFSHLISSRTNPLMSFPFKFDSSVFFPLTERCIVRALLQAENKKKNHLKGLKAAAINNLFLLILSKGSISKTGLGAFCRVFTELCKNSNEKRKPVILCCELIKANHKFAPILIASIMGVWPELFSFGGQVPEEEIILHSSLAFGLQKKPSSLTSADWKQCKAVFAKYLLSSPVTDVDETTKNLIEVFEEVLKETSKEKDYLLTDPLLIFAACKGWNWADKHLSCFVLSSLARYAQQKEDERAFSLFCNLYADISLLCPDFESCSEILEQLFTLEGAFEYVKGCAARSMIKLYLLSKHKFPPSLVDWTQENESQLIGTPTELLLKQRCMSDVLTFSENDIIAL